MDLVSRTEIEDLFSCPSVRNGIPCEVLYESAVLSASRLKGACYRILKAGAEAVGSFIGSWGFAATMQRLMVCPAGPPRLPTAPAFQTGGAVLKGCNPLNCPRDAVVEEAVTSFLDADKALADISCDSSFVKNAIANDPFITPARQGARPMRPLSEATEFRLFEVRHDRAYSAYDPHEASSSRKDWGAEQRTFCHLLKKRIIAAGNSPPAPTLKRLRESRSSESSLPAPIEAQCRVPNPATAVLISRPAVVEVAARHTSPVSLCTLIESAESFPNIRLAVAGNSSLAAELETLSGLQWWVPVC